MSQATTRHRRLNLRALVVLVVLAVLSIPGLAALRSVQNSRVKDSFLREARARYEKGDPGMALTYLNRYLQLDANHLDALILKSRILAETAATPEQIAEAAQLHVRILGLGGGDPASPDRIEARRRLIELSLKLPDRGQAAEAQARELVKILRDKGGEEAIDAASHRLLAESLEFASEFASDETKRGDLLKEARAEFEKAESMDPGDVPGAVRLASLYHERLNNDDEARAVLDRVVASNAGKPVQLAEALLARAQFGLETKGDRKAIEADIDRSLTEDPNNATARLTAARVALERRDTNTARQHLAAIPPGKIRAAELKLVEGLIELTDRKTDAAIAAWRAGLVASGGSDLDLTWRLAQALLEVGQIGEAEVLIDQFRRIAGGENNARYRYLLGLAYLKKNQPARAIAELEAVRYKLDLTLETQMQFTLGQAYEALRNYPKAIEAYRRSAEISRDWSGPWLALANLEMASETGQARATLRRGLAVIPGDPKLLGALARILTAEQLRKPRDQRRWAEIEDLLANAQKAAPGDPDVALVQAEYLATTDRINDAFSTLEAAARLRPESVELWLALASGAARRTELGEALRWLEEGIKAAGPQAGFYITQASVQVMKGDITRARDALVEGISRCPASQRPLLWKTLGELYQAKRDLPAARAAFEEWAKLQPENPEPRIALVIVAIDAGDEPAITKAIEAVRETTGANGYYWRYVRVEDLLRNRPGETDAKAKAARFEEARKLIAEIREADPKLPLSSILEGRILESEGKVDEAIAAYRQGIALNGGDAALNPLINLVFREKREDLIDDLRRTYPAGPAEFDRLAAVQALRAGNKGRAEQLAALAVQGDPQGVDVRTWQAEVLQALGKPAEAEATLKALIDRKPADPAPWLQLLMLQITQGRKADALATITNLRAKVKTDFPELLWAQCYRAADDLGQASESYQASLRRWPNDLGVLLSAVGFYQAIGRPEQAEAILRSVLARDPSNPLAKRRLAESLASHANDRAAWDEAVKLIGPDALPNDLPDDLLTRARVLAQGPSRADRAKAIAMLEKLIAELPGLDAARELLARLYNVEGQKARALEEIARVAEGPRPSPDAVLFHAAMLLASNEFDKAEAAIDRLTRSAPNLLPAAELRSLLLTARGRRPEAAKPLEDAFAAIPTGPGRVEAAPKVVRALLSIQQPEAAERVARAMAQDSPKGYGLLAQVLGEQGQVPRAAEALDSAAKAGDLETAADNALALAVSRPAEIDRYLELADRYLQQLEKAVEKDDKKSVAVLEKIALLRHLQKRHDEEVTVYKKILDRNPSNFEFLNNMAWTLAVDLGRAEEAIEWANKAVEKAGKKPEVLDTRGVILTRLGRFDEAITDLQAAIAEAGKPSPSYLFHLALAYHKKGDMERARAHRDQARSAGLDPARLQEAELNDWKAVKDL